MTEGPPLERLTVRLAECPQEFLAEPWCGGNVSQGGIRVDAVVWDLLQDLGLNQAYSGRLLEPWQPTSPTDRNRLRLVLVAAWLCHDEFFREAGSYGAKVQAWLGKGLDELANRVSADRFVTDPDRREELARLFLRAMDLLPAGETAIRAEDRLHSLDSVERDRVVRKTQAQLERARKLRAAMEAQKAKEAAAKFTSE